MRLAQLEFALQALADGVYALLPRRRPSRRALRDCRIIAHRGAWNGLDAPENTLAAFARALEAGAWGIELDLRWTRDTTFAELRAQAPLVPTLAEVIDGFAGKLHLMIELKQDRLDADAAKRDRLAELLGALTPSRDYHILGLHCGLFDLVDFAGPSCCIAVAELNVAAISRKTLARGYAGIGGHYLLLTGALLKRHAFRGQAVGTGFVASRYCLYRELNRGVDWIFTNHAPRLCRLRRTLLAQGDRPRDDGGDAGS